MNYHCPLEELRALLIRQRILEKTYNLNGSIIKKMIKSIKREERNYEMRKHDMNKDIQDYDVYVLTQSGRLVKADWIKSTSDYNHYFFHLHHFIEKQHYEENKKWYEERGIKQFLVLLPIAIHEQLHGIAIKTLSDEEFKARYKISKWALLFNRKYTEY